MTTVDTSLVTFKALSNFCISLEEVFGKQQRSLKLYVRLITKTTLSHEKAIKKHICAFRDFCIANRDALEVKDASKLTMDKISYSERVFIDIKRILSIADKETTSVIWKHLLTISALVDPTGKARQILKDSAKKDGGSGLEANFLSDIIGKVEKHVDPDANPMDAVASIMKSGVFAELVGGMGDGLQDGSLDLGKLMGTVQSMVSNLSGGEGGGEGMDLISSMMGSLSAGAGEGGEGGAPDLSGLMSTMMGGLAGGEQKGGEGGAPDLSGLMSMMGGLTGGQEGAAPDLGGIMNMVGPMLGALAPGTGGETVSIEDNINAQVNAARKEGQLAPVKLD